MCGFHWSIGHNLENSDHHINFFFFFLIKHQQIISVIHFHKKNSSKVIILKNEIYQNNGILFLFRMVESILLILVNTFWDPNF